MLGKNNKGREKRSMKKRALTVLLAALMVISLLAPAAMATDFETLPEDLASLELFQSITLRDFEIESSSAALVDFAPFAQDLYLLGLFRGVAPGNFALNRAPNRAEALVMLIRLLGAEEAAQTSTYEHPFNDVRGRWMEPYVAFAYEYDLTNGTTGTTFAPDQAVTAQMYVTFALRALGYSDAPGGDFAWAGALSFGAAVGVWDAVLAEGPFLRGHAAAVSFLTIAALMADEDYMLLEVLVDEGVVSAAAATPILNRIDLYDLYLATEGVLARSVATGGSSVQTITLTATIAGESFEETLVQQHPLPTDLVAFLEFGAFPFPRLVLLSEISGTTVGGATVLTKTFRAAFLTAILEQMATDLASSLAEELGETVTVAGTPTGTYEERLTVNAAGQVTGIYVSSEFTVNLLVAGVTMTVNSHVVTNIQVAFQG